MDTPLPPLDGRDISRIRTEVRLASLALSGLLAEEHGETATPTRVIAALREAEEALDDGVDALGNALSVLVEDGGRD